MLSRDQRADVAHETRSYFSEILENCGKELKEGIKNTTFYEKTDPLPPNKTPVQTQTRLIYGDTINVAIQMKEDGFNPCVLNFASEVHAGGGWLKGAIAQEEALFLRSTYDMSLSDRMRIDKKRRWSYPIPTLGGIYSPKVLVFRDDENNDYKVWKYKDCVYLDFVAVAAIRQPKLKSGHFSERDANITREKMKTIFRIAYLHGHDSLLLGAFGCGAFYNPPEDVASLFLQVMNDPEFKDRFCQINFAILDNSRSDNYTVFKRVLNTA